MSRRSKSKSTLADRYLAAIRGSSSSPNDAEESNSLPRPGPEVVHQQQGGRPVASDVDVDAANDGGEGRRRSSSSSSSNCDRGVKIEYTYRPPNGTGAAAATANNNHDNTNGDATGSGGGIAGGDTTIVVAGEEESALPKLTTAGVFPTSSTEEETTTDEEDDQPQPEEFAAIPLVRVGAATTGRRRGLLGAGGKGGGGGRRGFPAPAPYHSAAAASDVMSEASEPVAILTKEKKGACAEGGGAANASSAADNGGRGRGRRQDKANGGMEVVTGDDDDANAIGDAGNAAAAAAQENDGDEENDNYSFKPIPVPARVGGAHASTSSQKKAATSADAAATKQVPNASATGRPAGTSRGGGKVVKMWASKINCRADTTAPSTVAGMAERKSSSLASTRLMAPLVCAQPSTGALRKASVAGTAPKDLAVGDDTQTSEDPSANHDDADDLASALRITATMVRGSASPGRQQRSGGAGPMSDRKRQLLKGHQKQQQSASQPTKGQAQSPLREKAIWQRRRKERERRAMQLRQEEEEEEDEEEDDGTSSKRGPGSVVSVPASTLSTPATEVHTNRTSDFRRNLWLDRSAAGGAGAGAGGTSGAGGDDEGGNAEVANPQEEETDSEGDDPDLAADAEVRRLSQSESERAAARVATGKGGKTSSFAPVGGRVTPLTTEVGAEKDDGADEDDDGVKQVRNSAQVAGVKVDKSKGELNSTLATSKPPRTPKKVSIKPGGLVAARQKAFSGAAPSKMKSHPQKYRTRKSLADDISHADSSVATPAVAMTDDIVENEVDDVAEPLPPAFSPSIKADVSLTSSTDVELGVIGEEPSDGSDDKDPLAGMSFKVNRASRNTGKKKKRATSVTSNAEASSSSAASSSEPIWAQVKLRKTPQGAALQQTPTSEGISAEDAIPPAEDKGVVAPSSFPVQSLRPMPAPTDTSTPQSPPRPPNRIPLMLPNTKTPPRADKAASTVESHAASSIDWAPAQFSPGPFSAGKEAPAFQDGPAAPLLMGQEYVSRRVTNSVQRKSAVRTHTATAFGTGDRNSATMDNATGTKPFSYHRPHRVESFMSEESEGVQSLRHKFEASGAPKDGVNEDFSVEVVDHRNASSIRMKFEEMASPRPSGGEAVKNVRQVFEKKTIRDRAPQQVPLCDTIIFQQYDVDVDGITNAEETKQVSSTPKGVRDVRSTFEPESKRFSPEKQARWRAPQSRQPAMRRGIDKPQNGEGGDDDYRLKIGDWMSEVKEIRSRFDARPDPPIRSARTTGTSLSKVDSKDSGDRSQQAAPRWLDIDTNKTSVVKKSPFKSFDAQAQKASAVKQARTPHIQSSARRAHSTATSMASKASWPSSNGGRISVSSTIDFEDAVTLSPQSTVVSELTPSTLPSHTMLDSHSKDNSYGASAATTANALNFSLPSPSASTPMGLKMRDELEPAAASEVIPRSPDPPGKAETTPRILDPPESEEVSISPIPFRASPKKPIPPSPKTDNQVSLEKKEADTVWASFDAFGDDPFDPAFASNFSGGFNAFQSKGTPNTSTKATQFATTKAKSGERKLVEILSPPRVSKSFDSSEGSLDDAVSASTANTPLRSNRKGDSNFDVSEELGLSVRPKHVLANGSTSDVSKRLDELREARRARQSELSHTKSVSKASSESMAQSSTPTKKVKYSSTVPSPPRNKISNKLSQVARLGRSSPMRGHGGRKGTEDVPLTQQEDRYSPLIVESMDPVQSVESTRSKKKKGGKSKGLPRYGSSKYASVRKRLSKQ